jgi:hypothetical protein
VVDKVNRDRRVPLEFRTSLPQQRKNDVNPRSCWLSFRMDGIDPDVSLADDVVVASLTRDKFLAVEIMIVEGRSITIKDLIRHCANQKGAVHSQEPKSDKDKVLARVGSALRFGDVDASTRALVPIGMVTLKALRPLSNRVRGDLLSQGKFPAELAQSMNDSDIWVDLGWGVATNEEIPVTLQLSALPQWPQCVEGGKKFQIEGEVTYIEPTSRPQKVPGKGNS